MSANGFFGRLIGSGAADEGDEPGTSPRSGTEGIGGATTTTKGGPGRGRAAAPQEEGQMPRYLAVERLAGAIADLPPDVPRESAALIVRKTLDAAGVELSEVDASTRAQESRLSSEIGAAEDRQETFREKTREAVRSLEEEIRKAREACEEVVASEERKISRHRALLGEVRRVRAFFGFSEAEGGGEEAGPPEGEEPAGPAEQRGTRRAERRGTRRAREPLDAEEARHVRARQDGWAVVREGNERATSVHPTQAEAANEGRDIARKEETEFFLHARDGRVREHNSYVKDEPPLQRAEVAGRADQEAPEEQEEVVGQEGGDPIVRASDAAEQDHHGEPGPSIEGAGHTQEAQGSAAEPLDERSRELQERYAGYLVRDVNGEKIGEIDRLFLGENDQLEYLGSKTDPTESRSILIPMAASRVDDERRMIEVNALKYMIEDGPAFESEEEITPELERRVCDYYGITFVEPSTKKAVYGANYAASAASRGEEVSPAEAEGVSTGEEEVRMQRAEEEP